MLEDLKLNVSEKIFVGIQKLHIHIDTLCYFGYEQEVLNAGASDTSDDEADPVLSAFFADKCKP